MILKIEDFAIPAGLGGPVGRLYQVTSMTFGVGPSPQQLNYKPPVKIKKVSANATTSGGFGSSTGGTSLGWQAPGGFISTSSPKDSHGRTYQLFGNGQGQDFVGKQTTSVEALFLRHIPAYDPRKGPPGPSTPKGPFVYVQERVRVHGLPGALRVGSALVMHSCTVYSGKYPDGLHWLAIQRAKISLLAVADSLTRAGLVRYARTGICTS